jgi:hypothetical protein
MAPSRPDDLFAKRLFRAIINETPRAPKKRMRNKKFMEEASNKQSQFYLGTKREHITKKISLLLIRRQNKS